MEVLHPRCAGLDVHKKTVVACRLRIGPDGKVQRETRTFGTTTRELLRLQDWLREWECTHVALESTGEYWRPVYNLLEGLFVLLLVNPQHVKNVPGRKTDVKDAEWLAELLRHGLLRASFVPDRPQRELRDLTRGRCSLVDERHRVANRLQKVLEDAGVKLGSVASDVLGVSGRAMLAALCAGETDAAALAELARGSLRGKREALAEALEGRMNGHHRFLLSQHLEHLDHLERQLAAYDEEIGRRFAPQDGPEGGPASSIDGEGGPGGQEPGGGAAPRVRPTTPPTYARAVELVLPIPGLGRRSAEAILAETGLDMGRFPSAGHLSAWAGVAPGNHESAGKRLSGKRRHGNAALRTALVQAAHGACRTKGSSLKALYHRVASRRGAKRAIVAVAHALLVILYHVLLYQEPYRELGEAHLDERQRERTAKNLKKRLETIGYTVTLAPAPA